MPVDEIDLRKATPLTANRCNQRKGSVAARRAVRKPIHCVSKEGDGRKNDTFSDQGAPSPQLKNCRDVAN